MPFPPPILQCGVWCRAAALMGLAVVLAASPVAAQSESPDGALPDGGIPVTSELVHRVCSTCHPADDQRRMSRISYQRTTPEGWQQTIRRMVLLNDLQIEPADAREAVRYLATNHGLAPDEATLGAFEVERRNIDFYYEPDPETQETCNRCHSMGRVLNQRRTLEEWELLTAMHRGYYPFADFQSFTRSGGADPPAGEESDTRTPVELAIAHLAEVFPLDSPEWASWSANMRTPLLDGTWALIGHERGQGPVYGTVTVSSDPAARDELETQARYTYPARGVDVTRSGESLVYTGYQWRGRTTSPEHFSAREVMFVSRDRDEIAGRWFAGGYDERGIDVTLRRVGPEPLVTGIYPSAVPAAAGEVTLRLFGANLSESLDAAAVDLGADLTVTEVTDLSSTEATLRVTVAPDARVGSRDLFIGRAALTEAVTVYDEIHRLEVTPATGLARVGGLAFPKQYERFEARAWHDGPDGESATEDDLDLGMLADVDWSIEEYAVTYDDDDTAFVGTLGEHGVFEPAEDGPNPERSGERNNIGDVWVVATLTTAPNGAALERPLRARAHLLVTVPVYIRRGESGP